MYALLQVIAYGLFAAASALILAAVFVVIGSDHPRRNGIAFLAGFVFGTFVASVVALAVGQAFVDRLDDLATGRAGLTVLLGLVLVGVGLHARRVPPEPPVERSSRAAAILAGLGNVGPAATVSMAALLGFGGPKRLLLTFLAMGAVTDAHYRDVVDATLVAVYLVVSTIVVSVPVVIVIVAGERAAAVLGRGQGWLSEHSTPLRIWLSLGIGSALVLDGAARLLA